MTPTTTASRPLDAAAFAAEAERITNTANLDEWLALYHDDAVAEWIADGAVERHEGIAAIRRAATAQATIWREHRLRVRKMPQCADHETIVLTWTGGFGRAQRQFGTEIWTLRDGKVIRHQMYAYLDVRPSASPLARLRLALASPRIALALLRRAR
jgi:ketosteroid isomerase-like protein